MKRVLQIFVGLATLMCVATLVFCLRSFKHDDSAFWGGWHTAVRLESVNGSLTFSYTRTEYSLPEQGWSFECEEYEPDYYHRAWMSTPVKTRRVFLKSLDGRGETFSVRVAHWLMAVLLISPLAAVWLRRNLQRHRQRRLAGAGRCPTCGYDLRASAARCPECGTTIPQANETKAGVPAAELLPSEE